MMKNIKTVFILICASALVNVAFGQLPNQKFFQEGEQYLSQGEFVKAKASYQKAVRQLSGADKASVHTMAAFAMSMNNQAEEAYKLIELVEEQLDQKEISWSTEYQARWYLCLSAYHMLYREYDIALPMLKKINNSNVGFSSITQFYAAKVLGDYFYQQQQFLQANTLYEKAFKILQEDKQLSTNDKFYFDLALKLGELDDRNQKTEDALVHYKYILDKRVTLLSVTENKKREGELYYRVGAAYFNFMDYDMAKFYLGEAVDKDLKEDHFTEAKAMLADISVQKKEYETALEQSVEALKEWGNRKSEGKEVKFDALLNFGKIYESLEETKAIYQEKYQASLEEQTQENFSLKESLSNYGLDGITHLTQPELSGNFNFALLSFERAKILSKDFNDNEKTAASIQVLMKKGALYFKAKQYKLAREYYEKALAKMEGFYAKKHPLVSEASRCLAEIYAEEAVFGPAMSLINDALNSALSEGKSFAEGALPKLEDAEFPFELLYALGIKAQILQNMNGEKATEKELLKALETFELSMRLVHELRKTFKNDGAKYQLAALVNHFSKSAIELCYQLHQKTNKELYLEKAFGFTELGRSAILLNSLRDLKAKANSAIPQETLVKEQKIKDQIAYLNAQVYYELRKGKAKDLDKIIRWKTKLQAAEKAHEALLTMMEKDYPKYFSLKYNYKLPDVKSIQSSLEKGELLIEYVITTDAIYYFGITNKEVRLFKNKDFSEVQLKASLLKLLYQVEEIADFEKTAHLLYLQLIDPILKEMAANKLILVPDGELNYLPFDLLLRSNSSDMPYNKRDYLLKSFSISYAYSAQLFQESRNQSKEMSFGNAFLGLAPEFTASDEQGEKHWGALPHAQEEVEYIAQLLRGQAHTKTNATESIVKRESQSFAILHLATHGVLNHVNPLFSQLILEADAENDGHLHTFELYNTSLNTELVTLSACNSGVGELEKGEGAISLARGFAYAGCANIVMTLWEVSDYSTKEIMIDFYEYLQKGYCKDEALQKAKLNFIDKHDGKITHPYFWSGLCIIGSPDPVYSVREGFSMHWYEFLLIVLGLLGILIFTIWIVRRFKS